MPVRMRMIRQGDLLSAWVATNAPAYDEWLKIREVDHSWPQAVNVGLAVCKHWTSTTNDLVTFGFTNVVARGIVSVEANNSGVWMEWVDDLPLISGTNTGFVVKRSTVEEMSYSTISTTGVDTVMLQDNTAGIGTSYVYRVYALVDDGGSVSESLLGTSLPVRRNLADATLAASSINGIASEYIQPAYGQTVVGARVDPDLNNPWTATGVDVYPASAVNGLSHLGNFEANYNGSIVPEESGVYGFAFKADDEARVWVNGVLLANHHAWYNGKMLYSAPVYLEAGRLYVISAYFREEWSDEYFLLYWFKGDSPDEIVARSYLEPFPSPWSHCDIGANLYFGNAAFDEANQRFTVVSAGTGLSSSEDSAHLIWSEAENDFDIIASPELLGSVIGSGAGLLVRESLEADSRCAGVTLVASSDGSSRELMLSMRGSNAAMAQSVAYTVSEPDPELRISRRDSDLILSYRTSTSGGWVALTNLPSFVSGDSYAAMHAFSGDLSTVVTARFDQVSFFDAPEIDVAAVQNGREVEISVNGDIPSYYRELNAARVNNKYYFRNHYAFSTNFMLLHSDSPDGGFDVVDTISRGGGTVTNLIMVAGQPRYYRVALDYGFGGYVNMDDGSLEIASDTHEFTFDYDHGSVYYVDASRPDDTGDGTSWGTAKKSIQAAVNLSVDGDAVFVTNGTYALTSEIAVSNCIAIQSVNGPEMTIIDGQGACRGFNLGNYVCMISGLTISNGYASNKGGGVYCSGLTPIITNCYIVSNYSSDGGGGTAGGTLYNCVVKNNYDDSPWMGTGGGGGVHEGRLYNCLLTGNYSWDDGGGAIYSVLNNCTISDNQVLHDSGGVADSTLFNCIVWGNSRWNIPGSYWVDSNCGACSLNYTCSPDASLDNGNITNNPQFVDAVNGDFRLASGSPCIDAGDNACVSSTIDLAGIPRVINGCVDMGAYEYMFFTFNNWMSLHGLMGLPEDVFTGDWNSDGIVNGFDYAFGDNLSSGEEMLDIDIINGTPVVVVPVQDAETVPYIDVNVLGTTNFVDWNLPITPALDTTGKPANRNWFETEDEYEKAYFKLKAELK